MRIRAAVLEQTHTPFRIQSVDLEAPRPGEALVRIAAAGVCHSDWHLVTGETAVPMPVVGGHEGAGVVEALGDGVSNVAVGDHIALNWAPGCGNCYYCSNGRPAMCSARQQAFWSGTLLGGGTRFSRDGQPVHHFTNTSCFADHIVVPAACCVKIKRDVPFEIGALIGCAVTTGVGAALNTVRIAPGNSAAVFGAGGVGLSILMGLAHAGAKPIIAVDRTEEKQRTCFELGATDTLINGDDTVAAIQHLTDGRGVDFAFDTTGHPDVQRQCIDAVRRGGTVVLVGLATGHGPLPIPAAILTRQEKSIVGSYYGSTNPAVAFNLYADLYQQGKLPLDKLITQRYSLDQINEAYEQMLTGKIARGVIVF